MSQADAKRTLEEALRAARGALGTPEQVARLRNTLHPQLTAAETGAAEPASSAAVSSSWKLFALLLVGAAASYVALRPPEPNPAGPKTAEPVAAPQPSPPPAAEPATALQPAPIAVEPAAAPATGATRAAAQSRARVRAAPLHAGEPPAIPQPSAADPEAEIALITRAQAAIDRQPALALPALLEHERRFPNGLLAEERDVLRFEVERALGHRADALARGRAFVARYPTSTQARRIQRWLDASDHNPSAEPPPTP